jgi:translation initiation factor IF-2
MSEEKTIRLNKAARDLNVGWQTCVEFLAKKGFVIESNPNAKVTQEQYNLLSKEYADSAMEKEEASHLTIGKKHNENVVIDTAGDEGEKSKEDDKEIFIKSVGQSTEIPETKPANTPAVSSVEKKTEEAPKEEEKSSSRIESPKLPGTTVIGKIDLDKPKAKTPPAEVEKPAEKPIEPKIEAKKEVAPEAKPVEKPAAEAPVAKVVEKPKEEVKETPKQPIEAKKEEPKVEKLAETKVEAKKEEPKAVVNPKKEEPRPEAKKEAPQKLELKPEVKDAESESGPVIRAEAEKLRGLNVLGKIELPDKNKKKKVTSSDAAGAERRGKKRRKRKVVSKEVEVKKDGATATPRTASSPGGQGSSDTRPRRGKPAPQTARRPQKEEPSDKEIQEKIKATLARLSGNTKGGSPSRSKYRRDKRSAAADAEEERARSEQDNLQTLKVTEFISANDLASLMDVNVNDIIAKGLGLGMFISINQRLDAESITFLADEFGYSVEFISTEDEELIDVNDDEPEDLGPRAPIVTIMGHVDHGKTSLLDYIRSSKVTAGEAGGITQHIGAYDVTTDDGRRIAFLDTPGHEAFTAMRARGAKITDVAIIVVAADDAVMPQTKEAINHAQVAGVPIVIAINKVDRPNANPEKIKEQLSAINILVEDWGGKYQCQHISAKTGQGIDDLLEKVLLEAELLELKANPDKLGSGTVVEASLDKGKGYVSTVMVQNGSMSVGDVIIAGSHYGKIKAMFNHKGEKVKKAGPATPVLVLGLGGAPQAGDKFNIMGSEREAREIANKREQIQREQSMRTKKHITLDEIGRRLAIGSFKELNLIVKGDVDGSIEALSDSLLKLSNEEVKVNIIHKGVGQISESDVLLASASDAIIMAFQVRPSASARKLAEQEEIEIRMFSIIYDAINVIKDAIEGMLSPDVEEVITGTAEIREVFKISKVGTVAGCMVQEGFINRKNKIRLIRDGIVIYTGDLGALKRFKDDVNEVKKGYECGMSIQNFNNLEEGDSIEGFTMKETKRKLK